MTTTSTRRHRAQLSLEGLATGDAFGECFFVSPSVALRAIAAREVPRPPPWRWTDDTAMAISVVRELREGGAIEADSLARRFGAAYLADPRRGYGGAAHEILAAIGRGADWRVEAAEPFGGQGSFGNGAAMRVAPLGAYLGADDLPLLAQQARESAVVTHAHPEGQAGAVAVAIAAALHAAGEAPPREELFARVLELVPDGPTAAGVASARELVGDVAPADAAARLGAGQRVSAQDTVPFVPWILGRRERYEEALWQTVSGLGDRDTTCAMVGGVRVLVDGVEAIPASWRAAREQLPVT